MLWVYEWDTNDKNWSIVFHDNYNDDSIGFIIENFIDNDWDLIAEELDKRAIYLSDRLLIVIGH